VVAAATGHLRRVGRLKPANLLGRRPPVRRDRLKAIELPAQEAPPPIAERASAASGRLRSGVPVSAVLGEHGRSEAEEKQSHKRRRMARHKII
jgi:hypothetical protein